VAAVQVLALTLELIEPDHLGQVGIQQPLLLALELAQGVADGRLAGLEFLGQPGAAPGTLQGVGDLGGVGQQRAQVGPDQLVELSGGIKRELQRCPCAARSASVCPRHR
jgi:hypothetical protein